MTSRKMTWKSGVTGLSPLPARAPYLSVNALGYSRCFAFSRALSQIFRSLLFPLSLSLPFRMLFKEKPHLIDGRTDGMHSWHAWLVASITRHL
jgi:hypothetical protein